MGALHTAPSASAELELASELVEAKAPVLPAFTAAVKQTAIEHAPAPASATPIADLKRTRRATRRAMRIRG